MFRALVDWLDHRAGVRRLVSALLLEHIPGGARWRYVWGSTLAFVFFLQVVTGVLLMTGYVPSAKDAWGSVMFIQYQTDFGWLIRGLHHFGSQAMMVLLALHMLQVVIAGAHLPPREINWWLGLALMGLVLGMGLTGYLLPWDQKGYFATRVATSIMAEVPVIGREMQTLLVGGPEYGTPTLTRFYALHVAILPALIVVLLIAHLAVFRRHGVTYPKHAQGEGWFWPDQAFRDMVVCLIIFGILVTIIILPEFTGQPHGATVPVAEEQGIYEYWAKAGQRGLGANLDSPADPSKQYIARPEWYFLSLFQLLKEFPGDYFLIGAVVIPGAIGFVLFLLPLLGAGRLRPLGHVFGVVFVTAVLTSVVTLTCYALAADTGDEVQHVLLQRVGQYVAPAVALVLLLFLGILALLPPGGLRAAVSFLAVTTLTVLVIGLGLLLYAGLHGPVPEAVAKIIQQEIETKERSTPERAKKFEEALTSARHFQEMREENHRDAERAIRLAVQGMPPEGSSYLLSHDPQTQFKPVFLHNCAVCHSYGEFSKAEFQTTREETYKNAKFTASDLAGFGTKERIHQFLLHPESDRFYGRMKDKEGKPLFYTMSDWVKEQRDERKAAKGNAGLQQMEADFAKIAAWLATHPTGKQWDKGPHAEAYKLFVDEYRCVRCHGYEDIGKNRAPDLTGYESADWLRRMIRSPDHPKLYGENNRMPAFRDLTSLTIDAEKAEYAAFVGKELKTIQFGHLSDVHREILVRYLTGDPQLIFGGTPIAAPKKDKK